MPYTPGDIFVLLPGITGSVLAHHGKEVWGPSAGSILRALRSRGESVTELQLASDDPDVDDLGDGVTATRLVPDVTLIPGFWKIDGYTKIAQSITQAFDLVKGKTFFEFPYDWRRHNAVAARKLQRNVHDWLQAQKSAGVGDPKAVLLSHSMGGLVSRHFLEVLGGWRQTRALISFGTPYRGSFNALGYLANGYKMAGLDLTSLLRTLTSVYELLPIYPSIFANGAPAARVAELSGLPHVDQARAATALEFHRKIESEQKLNAALPGYGYQIVPLVGFEQPTMQSARFVAGKVVLLATLDGQNDSGDGTVPRISATPIELSGARREVFASERHGSLQNNDALLAQVRAEILQPSPEHTYLRAGPPVGLSVSFEDAYLENEVVEIGVKASSDKPEMEAVLQDAVTNVEITRAPVRRGGTAGQRVLFDRLPAGHYRFSFHGANVSPVTDVFLVAPASGGTNE
jgi:pimeloyl-ACP methyl ester carboxylesterase